MDASLETTNNQILEIDQQIEKESRRMALQTQTKHDETQRKIDEEKGILEQSEKRLTNIMMERKNTGLEVDRINQQGIEEGNKLRTLQDQIQHCEAMIKTAKEREHDFLVPYGRSIKTILEKIRGIRWFGEKPLGPLGQFVKAKDAVRWGDILRSQLTSLLCAFAVTDARDRAPLKKLFLETGK
jgi:chromosome segregation ATPase